MIEYIEETHQYLYEGVLIPSVSMILHKTIFKDKYKEVPEYILTAKAQYGSQVHEAIEILEQNNILIDSLNNQQLKSIQDYLEIKKENNLEVIEQEKIVCYKGIYAGRFDMIATVDGNISLLDVKTTAKLDIEYLSWQLSLYELAYGKKFKKLYAIWLPKKEPGQLVEIPRKSKKEIEKLLEELKDE